MTAHNFTLSDLRAVVTAFSLFPLFVFVPGYVAAWLLDLCAFRRRTLAFRCALSVPLSISLCPVVIYLLARSLSMAAVWGVFGALWLAFVPLLVTDRRRLARDEMCPSAARWPILGLAAAWILLALFSLVDMQLGGRLYYSVIGFDYSIRSLMIHSLATHGIPARSPFFFPGRPVDLHYHYFWLILCSLVERTAGGVVTGRQALIGGTPWSGIGLMGILALYLRLFSAHCPARLGRRTTIAIALLGVTGLDILPSLLLVVLRALGLSTKIFPSMEWWNEQVDGWIYTMLWEPHHLAGLIACLTGFLILWLAPEESDRRGLLKNSLVAGIAFATAVGSSIHVVFVFALFLIVWGAITLWRRWHGDTVALIVAGVTATLVSLPYLAGLLGLSLGSGSGAAAGTTPSAIGPPLQWTVRGFMLPDMVMRSFGLEQKWQLALGDLILLPLNYFMELGLYFAVGWLRWRSWQSKRYVLDRQEMAAGAMAGISVLTCTFLRSSLIGNNDLGWRGFLFAQFVLLLWAVDLLADWPRVPRKAVLVTLIGLGVAATLYDIGCLRLYPLLADHGNVPYVAWMSADSRLGPRTYAVREAYEWAGNRIPATALIQHNPDVKMQDTAAGLYANRQMAAFDSNCTCTFGGDPKACAPIASSLKQLFSAAPPPERFTQVCDLSIDVLVAKDTDPAWNNKDSWIWRRKPLFANQYVRLFACR